MEYRNLHTQNQLQEQVPGQSSLPITSRSNNWNTSTNFLNHGTSTVYPTDETIPNSRLWPLSPATSFTTQDLMMSYSTTTTDHDHARGFHQRLANIDQSSSLPNIKEEPLDSFSKLRINLGSPYSDVDKSNYLLSTMYKQNHVDDQDFYSNINAQSNASFGAGFTGHVAATNGYDHGHVFPVRTTSSSTSLLTPLLLTSGGFNLQALDLLMSPATSTFRSQSCSPSSHSNHSNLSLYSQSSSTSLGHGHDMQEYSRSSPSNSSNMTSAYLNEVTRTKRPSSSSFSGPKESRAESKKSKSMLRTSNPPLKVRKEKLGDRIAALHRLVAPFGKTDTASVLTEAIGYIQFLHDQVQTLSIPYMKSLHTKSSKKMHQVHGLGKEEETELNKMDLRSRGLCLVPLSCVSYLNGFD